MRKVTLAWCSGAIFFSAVTSAALVGMFRRLGASTFTIGVLSAIPPAVMLIEPLSSYFVRRATWRKRFFLSTAYPGRIVWIPLVMVGWLLPESRLAIPIMLALVVVYRLSQDISSPAWFAWIMEIVPADERGRFWGSRQSWGTLSGTVAAVLLGRYLGTSPPFEKFVVFFTIAAVCGWLDIFIHRGVHGVAVTPMPPEEQPSLRDVLTQPLRDPRFRPLVIFTFCFALAGQLGGAMFQILLLEEIHLSYFEISLFLSGVVGGLVVVSSRVWGRLMDNLHEGERLVFYACTTLMGLVAFSWSMVPTRAHVPIALVFVVAGIATAGYQISNMNLVIAYSPPEARASYMAVNIAMGGLGSMIGSMISGAAAQAFAGMSAAWGPFILTPVRTLYLVAGTAQILCLPLLVRIRQPDSRPVRRYIGQLFSLNPFDRRTWGYVRRKLGAATRQAR